MSYRLYRRPGINPIWVLIGVTFVVFVANIISRGLITARFGFTPIQFPEEWWTPFTYMFVHEDFMHILFNMLTLFFFGTFVISLVGETAFLLTYFVGGFMGGLMFYLLSVVLNTSQLATMIGASGAIYALGGLLMVMRPNIRVLMFFMIPMPLWVAILIGLALVSFLPGIAWQAHLGGVIFGAVVGYYYRRREYRRY